MESPVSSISLARRLRTQHRPRRRWQSAFANLRFQKSERTHRHRRPVRGGTTCRNIGYFAIPSRAFQCRLTKRKFHPREQPATRSGTLTHTRCQKDFSDRDVGELFQRIHPNKHESPRLWIVDRIHGTARCGKPRRRRSHLRLDGGSNSFNRRTHPGLGHFVSHIPCQNVAMLRPFILIFLPRLLPYSQLPLFPPVQSLTATAIPQYAAK